MPTPRAALPRSATPVSRRSSPSVARGTSRASRDAPERNAARRSIRSPCSILVVDRSTRTREHVALRSMFAARKRLFVDLLKRDLPILAGRFVVDDRDGPEATYVIVVDGAGGHCASARITPLTGPDPIRDTVDRSVQPAAQPSDIVEIAHLCLAPELSAGERRIARALLFRRLAEFVRANGVRHVVGHASEPQVRRLEARGWPCRRIDGPAPDGKRSLAAIAVDVDGMTLSKLAAIGAVAPGRAAGRAR